MGWLVGWLMGHVVWLWTIVLLIWPIVLPATAGQSFRTDQVRGAFLHAWRHYRLRAEGSDEMNPVTGRKQQGIAFGGQAAQVVDALDTLILLGLQSELSAVGSLVQSVSFKHVQSAQSVFELNIRFLGGLLSAHALSGDQLYLDRAKDIAHSLLPAFNTSSRLPKSHIIPSTGAASSAGLGANGVLLAEAGSLTMEFAYLAYATKDPRWAFLARDAVSHIAHFCQPDGACLLRNHWEYVQGNMTGGKVNWGAEGDSFYEYLLKAWLLTGQADDELLQMYLAAVRSLKQELVAFGAVSYPTAANGGNATRTTTSLAYTLQLEGRKDIKEQDHLACYLPGLLALGASVVFPNGPATPAQEQLQKQQEEDLELAQELLQGCVLPYLLTPTGLAPDKIAFDLPRRPWSLALSRKAYERPKQLSSKQELWGSNVRGLVNDWPLRPETVESLFVLYRTTKDNKYRQYGWQILQSLEQWSRTAYGYSGVKRVDVQHHSPLEGWDGQMPTYFLAETLKYLYLLFSDEEIWPLDRYVFTTEGHPLPVFSWPAYDVLREQTKQTNLKQRPARATDTAAGDHSRFSQQELTPGQPPVSGFNWSRFSEALHATRPARLPIQRPTRAEHASSSLYSGAWSNTSSIPSSSYSAWSNTSSIPLPVLVLALSALLLCLWQALLRHKTKLRVARHQL